MGFKSYQLSLPIIYSENLKNPPHSLTMSMKGFSMGIIF
ncbi:hypothetical protein PSAR109036_03225 [Psychrobacter arenosus]